MTYGSTASMTPEAGSREAVGSMLLSAVDGRRGARGRHLQSLATTTWRSGPPRSGRPLLFRLGAPFGSDRP